MEIPPKSTSPLVAPGDGGSDNRSLSFSTNIDLSLPINLFTFVYGLWDPWRRLYARLRWQ